MPKQFSHVRGVDQENKEEKQEGLKSANRLYKKLLERKMAFQDEEERKFYMERAREYIRDYPMLNPSADMDDLHLLLVELVVQRRIQSSGNPQLLLDDRYTDSLKRSDTLKGSFAVRRADRKKYPEKQDDFIKVMQELFSSGNSKKVIDEDLDLLQEEQQFTEEKQHRDKEMGLVDG